MRLLVGRMDGAKGTRQLVRAHGMQMAAIDQRRNVREASFLLADVQVAGDPSVYRVKVRNLSALGMMGEGPAKVVPGSRLTINFDEVPEVIGAVAWVQQGRFGVAFDEEIDPASLLKSA